MTEATGRLRRHALDAAAEPAVVRAGSKFSRGSVIPAPPPPGTAAAAPHGDLSAASADDLSALTRRVWPAAKGTAGSRVNDLRRLLGHLAEQEGQTWQQRWEATLFASGARPVSDLETGWRSSSVTTGLRTLFALRVIVPALPAFRANHLHCYPEFFCTAQNDPALRAFFEHVATIDVRPDLRQSATFDVSCALTVYGIALADLTPEVLLHYAWECRRHRVTYKNRGCADTFGGLLAWRVLHETGHFPAGTPHSIRAAGQRGRLTVTELVDRQPLGNPQVRQLLIDYLERRAPEVDYSTLRNLAANLARLFWAKIERIAPGQPDLRLLSHVYDQWRAEIRYRENGQPRTNVDDILVSVRSLYLDLQAWAPAEPERWAHWVAPCPVRNSELVGSGKRQRRARERSADRTRQRQPLLPVLLAHAEDRCTHHRQLLAQAEHATAGQVLTIGARRYQRVWTTEDQRFLARNGHVRIRVQDEDGTIINLTRAEDTAFWQWAIISTLRHTGVRIEELLELTQMSIRRYQRPGGETIGLLVIAPSKSDRERVIPMSAELFAVIAAILRRHTAGGRTIPLLTRYDTHEKTSSPPLPFLFQRQLGATRSVINQGWVLELLRRCCQELAASHPAFASARFTPHDFRRLFATDLVNNGLPIHIGATLLGHLDLETTRGYVAVFEEDLIRHYQAFLDRRRRERPAGEYRPLAAAEWNEFQQHFDKRKVELGNCARPYGTPCAHEHACLRCPMLHVNPAMLNRLDSLETDLTNRRARATSEGWLGEIEGLDLTLSHLRAKRDQTQRAARAAGPVHLGLPAPSPRNHRQEIP